MTRSPTPRSSDLSDAVRSMALYTSMEQNGVAVNHIAYTALINAHTRNGAVATAGKLLSGMQQSCLTDTNWFGPAYIDAARHDVHPKV